MIRHKLPFVLFYFLVVSFSLISQNRAEVVSSKNIKILNFYGDNGFVHPSKEAGLKLIENLGIQNKWEVVSTADTSIFNPKDLRSFNVIVFNNNCGNKGRILSEENQLALQKYIRNGRAGGLISRSTLPSIPKVLPIRRPVRE